MSGSMLALKREYLTLKDMLFFRYYQINYILLFYN